jgi:hypothetical protein
MRELAKSLSSFSWALSLFGAQQVLRLVRDPLAGGAPGANGGLESVARAAQGTLSGAFERTFQAGDQVQRSALDLAFSLASPEAWERNRFVALSSRALQQSTAALRRLLPGGEEPW